MILEENYKRWKRTVENNDLMSAYKIMEESRKHVHKKEEIPWILEALQDNEKKFFVQYLFKIQPVPKKIMPHMVYCALTTCDIFRMQFFLNPCTETYGKARIRKEILNFSGDEKVIKNGGVKKSEHVLLGKLEKTRGIIKD